MGFFGGLFKTNVEKMERKRDVKGLIRALNHKDKEVKIKAIQALGRIKDVRAIAPLNKTLSTWDRDILREAWNALKTIGEPTGETLTIMLKKIRYKKEAMEILQTMEKPPIEPLIEALKGSDFRGEAREVLKRIGEPAVEPLIQLLKDGYSGDKTRARYVLEEMGEIAVEPLMRIFMDEYRLRMGAASSLGEIERRMRVQKNNKKGKIIEFLLEALKHKNDSIRIAALAGIGSSKVVEPITIQPIMEALKDPSSSVRREAVRNLAFLLRKEAVEPLIEVLKDEDPDVQKTVRIELEKIGTKEALAAIGKKRRMTTFTIGDMIRKGDVKGLSEGFQRAGNWDTREWAVVGLERMLIDKVEFDKAEMIKALNDIIQVCEAEIGGGTYRTNCIEVAKRSLRKIAS